MHPSLAPLTRYRQFVLWERIERPDGRIDKIPLHHQTLRAHDAHDAAAWIAADQAEVMAETLGLGVAFVFTESDPFFFIDIDDCYHNGQWSQFAASLCGRFDGCAVEISTSGKGLHIIGTLPTDSPPHTCDPGSVKASLFTERRFVALTGNGAVGSADHQPSDTYRAFVREYFTPSVSTDASWTTEPVPEWSGPDDDQDLIKRMLASKSAASAFGGRASVQELWGADETALSEHYPDDQGARPFDWSKADAALCQHLAFWTGKDCERIDRIFRESALMRDKWDRPDGYNQRTILKAVSMCNNAYRDRRTPTPVLAPATPSESVGLNYLTIHQQQEYFKGCVYVRDQHRVFTPDGGMLRPEQFKAMYGGYIFSMDTINDKTTKSAFEAFTENRGYIFSKVYRACFRPELAAGAVIEEAGQTMVNTYVPTPTPSAPGDAGPFLNHLALMLPDENDRSILLAYMAACVQHIGCKFQWAPLLQGTQGNGKSMCISCIAEAVGWNYTHKPNSRDLGNKFNGWIFRKVFIGVEEIYVQDRQDAIDTLKPMITDDRIEVQGKTKDQVTEDNRANFFMCTNHKDAVRITKDDRRFCVFYTAQQTKDDIKSAGMGGDYFPNLYNWLKRDGGYAIVTNYLKTHLIPDELNPATRCHRAPKTSSTNEAIRMSMGGIEQDIMEAVDEGRPGFANGWISTMALGRLLERRKITQNKRREILHNLGYVTHPSLPNGRVNNPILAEGGKPRLYVKLGHINQNISEAAHVRNRYIEDQGWAQDVGGVGAGQGAHSQ